MSKCKLISCDNEVTTGKVFCSLKCSSAHRQYVKVEDWLAGRITGYKKGFRVITAVRDFLLEKAGYQCELCGWNKINPKSGKTPLEIDHIDGDCANNTPDNLRVICPNCHSLTPNWKALNKGKGNRERHKYSRLIE